MSKKKKIAAAILIAFAILIVAGVIILSVLYSSSSRSMINKTEIQEFQTDSPDFKVAVISDTQLPPTDKQLAEDDTYLINLKKALTVMKKQSSGYDLVCRRYRRSWHCICFSDI